MWTSHPDADAVLSLLVDGQRRVLGDDLIGAYLFGSAATGTFEPGVSDLDTIAVLRSDATAGQLAALAELHARIVRETPGWEDRVEVVYLSTHALRNFREPSPAARIAPGEPFHAIEVDDRWLIDWYQVRASGIALHGPSPDEVVPPITSEEDVEAVRRHLLEDLQWRDGLQTPAGRAYAILSMCRGLRTFETGEHVSKREGARWAAEVMPEYAGVIAAALAWRSRDTARPAMMSVMTEEAANRLVVDVQRRLRAEP
jgi:hypothetical protein